MARLNVDEKWWIDSSRTKLIRLFKGDSRIADGLMLQTIRISQEHVSTNFMVPLPEIMNLEDWENLFLSGFVLLFEANAKQIEANTAETKQMVANVEQTIASVKQTTPNAYQFEAYVRGSRKHHSWLVKRHAAARKGGKKSGSTRRKKSENDPKTPLNHEANAKQIEANLSKPRKIEPSSSSSSSSSNSFSYSSSDSNNICAFDFEEIYKLFPKRAGDPDKAGGMKLCKSKIKTPEQYANLKIAVNNFRIHNEVFGKIETEGVKQFSTFMDKWGINGGTEYWINPDPYQLEKPKSFLNGAASPKQTIGQQSVDLVRQRMASRGEKL